jgi:hypothetical protein
VRGKINSGTRFTLAIRRAASHRETNTLTAAITAMSKVATTTTVMAGLMMCIELVRFS